MKHLRRAFLALTFLALPLFVALVSLAHSTPARATSSDSAASDSATTLTTDQIGAISVGCDSIKQSLRSVQKSDARTRTYLGSVYQTLQTKYLVPLDTRLTNLKISDPTLTTTRYDFAATRATFVSAYKTYSSSLSSLLAIDCKTSPAEFYTALESVREQRAAVADAANDLAALAGRGRNAVLALKTAAETPESDSSETPDSENPETPETETPEKEN